VSYWFGKRRPSVGSLNKFFKGVVVMKKANDSKPQPTPSHSFGRRLLNHASLLIGVRFLFFVILLFYAGNLIVD